MPITEYAHPTSLKEAVALLADPQRKAIPVGGGTALSQGGRRGAELLVDLSRCGLDAIRVDGGRITLGATARAHDVACAELPGAAGRLLNMTAARIATQPLRNAITVGGNLMHLASWADFPVALLCLEATARAEHARQGPLKLPVATLLADHPTRVLPEGALLTALEIPGLDEPAGVDFRRFRHSLVDYSLATVAARVELDGNKIARLRVCVGALCARPQRLDAIEKHLQGKTPRAAALAEAARLGAAQIDIVPNYRMSQQARARIVEVEIRRALEQAVARAKAQMLALNGGAA